MSERTSFRGQSVVEFAVASVVVILLLVITVDFSRAFSAYLTVGNMARAGAQAGSINGVLGAESKDDAEALIEEVAYQEQSLIFGGTPTVDSRLCQDSSGHDLVQVRVRHDFEPLFAIGPISGPYPIERKVELRAQIADMRAEFDGSCM